MLVLICNDDDMLDRCILVVRADEKRREWDDAIGTTITSGLMGEWEIRFLQAHGTAGMEQVSKSGRGSRCLLLKSEGCH